MNKESQAQIYLASQRGRSETGIYRSFHTFNFGKFRESTRGPFLSLNALNDETLAAGKTASHVAVDDALVCVIPLVGSVDYASGEQPPKNVYPGNCELFFAMKGSRISFHNPFDEDLINYLTLWLKPHAVQHTTIRNEFDLDRHMNSLVHVLAIKGVDIFIGKFRGRVTIGYTLHNKNSGLFALVIEGAVEFENRLLQQRDGLSLMDETKVEFESLSAESIVLLVEMRVHII